MSFSFCFVSTFCCSVSLSPLTIFYFFSRNDNTEKSLESYREAFDIVYLVSRIRILCLNI